MPSSKSLYIWKTQAKKDSVFSASLMFIREMGRIILKMMGMENFYMDKIVGPIYMVMPIQGSQYSASSVCKLNWFRSLIYDEVFKLISHSGLGV